MLKDNKLKPKKFSVSKNNKNILRQAIYHPHPDVQRKCFAILLLSFLFSANLVALILDITPQSVRNYWNIYKKGGIDALQINNYKGKVSSLHDPINSINEEFDKNPPSSIKEAASKIEKITGIKRSIKSVRSFLKKNLKFRYRKVCGIPAKANVEKQKDFLEKQLEPLLKKAKKKSDVVLFVDAAHFVHGAFLGFLWSIKRIFVKTPSGRKRFNVLGAVNAITRRIHYLYNDTYINAMTVCDLLKIIAKSYAGKTITLIMDNARYQKCELVTVLAAELKIKILYLPPYSPNLNIIERLWKFIKKKSLNSKYHETFLEFQTAILESLKKTNNEWKEEISDLLTLEFQTFDIDKTKDVV